ncbi:MAG TPA: hypothetical protein VHR41_01345 [Gemmatimonadales bacterium]|jgi:hypothetical protein|nr:hypothetical protein [Gemmatimonadales bacterium]
MYRIELSPGEETVFRTIEELAIGVRNGVISPRARIYHNASQKWLPIEFHPHYKKAMEILNSKTAPRAMAQPVPVGAGSGPLPAPILAPAPEPTLTPVSEPAYAPRQTPAPMSRPAPVASPRDTPMPAPAPAPAPAPVRAPAPMKMPWEAKAPAPPVDSPVLLLAKLSYPEVTPAEEPVAHASPARVHAGGRRMVQVAVVASVVVACTFVMMRASARPATLVAPRARSINHSVPAADRPEPPPLRATAPRPTASASSSTGAAMVTVPGPAFAPGTIGAKPAGDKPVVAAKNVVPKSGATDSTPVIEPAPVDVDISAPVLPATDSLSVLPKSAADSNAIGRILRAVGGTRPTQSSTP